MLFDTWNFNISVLKYFLPFQEIAAPSPNAIEMILYLTLRGHSFGTYFHRFILYILISNHLYQRNEIRARFFFFNFLVTNVQELTHWNMKRERKNNWRFNDTNSFCLFIAYWTTTHIYKKIKRTKKMAENYKRKKTLHRKKK